MAITGHKSIQTLAIYQKIQCKQKVAMGKVLLQSVMRKEDDIEVSNQRAPLAPMASCI